MQKNYENDNSRLNFLDCLARQRPVYNTIQFFQVLASLFASYKPIKKSYGFCTFFYFLYFSRKLEFRKEKFLILKSIQRIGGKFSGS